MQYCSLLALVLVAVLPHVARAQLSGDRWQPISTFDKGAVKGFVDVESAEAPTRANGNRLTLWTKLESAEGRVVQQVLTQYEIDCNTKKLRPLQAVVYQNGVPQRTEAPRATRFAGPIPGTLGESLTMLCAAIARAAAATP